MGNPRVRLDKWKIVRVLRVSCVMGKFRKNI